MLSYIYPTDKKNNAKSSTSHICDLTPNGLVNYAFEATWSYYKTQFHVIRIYVGLDHIQLIS